MTQYLAKCLTCGGMVSHLDKTATVAQCDACKGEPPKKGK